MSDYNEEFREEVVVQMMALKLSIISQLPKDSSVLPATSVHI